MRNTLLPTSTLAWPLANLQATQYRHMSGNSLECSEGNIRAHLRRGNDSPGSVRPQKNRVFRSTLRQPPADVESKANLLIGIGNFDSDLSILYIYYIICLALGKPRCAFHILFFFVKEKIPRSRPPVLVHPSQPLFNLDVTVLVVAAASVILTFCGGAGILLKPSWSFALEQDVLPPPPVVVDLDGDGVAEVVVATPDGRLLVLSPAADRADAPALNHYGNAAGEAAVWRALPARYTASLRSHTGLATGRRPLALAAGLLSDGAGGTSGGGGGGGGGGSAAARAPIVVALTEDWTVLAFDDKLRPLWEHSLGVGGGSGSSRRKPPTGQPGGGPEVNYEEMLKREVTLLVAAQSIYTGDIGMVLIGGRTEHDAGGEQDVGMGEASAPSAPSAPGRSHSGHGSGDGHFNYFALEGSTGTLRWSHLASDFHKPLHGDETFMPQMDYRLDLDSVGGGAAGIDGRHQGERPWRLFSESVLRLLPVAWRHPHDTSLRLTRFERSKRLSARKRSAHALDSHARHASGTGALKLTSSALSSVRSAVGSAAAPASVAAPDLLTDADGRAAAASTAPSSPAASTSANAIVATRRHGLEVLHLFTGRPLTQLPLFLGAAHGDVNGDGSVDHVTGLSSEDTAAALSAEGNEHLAEHFEGKKGKGKGKGKKGKGGGMPNCLGMCSSGVPVRESLWNVSVCSARKGAPARWASRRCGLRLGAVFYVLAAR